MTTAVTAAGEREKRQVKAGLLDFTLPQTLAFGVLVAAVVAAPLVLYPVFLMKIMCFGLFAAAFNLLIGHVGLLSFGHAAFFGMGAYLSAYAAKTWGVTPEISILLGALVGAVLGLAVGWLAIRRSGIYFAMITLALAQMIFFFCLQASFTGGEDGIQSVPRNSLVGVISLQDDGTMYWFVVAIFLLGLLAIQRIVSSPFGEVLRGIRENESRTVSLGYRVEDYKLLAFVLSATLAGVAGATKSLVFGIATLTDVHWTMSGEVILMSLVGGLGTVFGPILGAGILIAMQNYFAQFGAWVTVIQGAIFVLCVLAFRSGIVGEIGKRLRVAL
ncbi:branched-chain amino acid ABC transporter permease [Brucella intermedia]|uniref:branched-chain amino acid ABC transporter permease n=1 Tax=Brucella intermedia TaxID=94625 RepID=UPI003207E3A2